MGETNLTAAQLPKVVKDQKEDHINDTQDIGMPELPMGVHPYVSQEGVD